LDQCRAAFRLDRTFTPSRECRMIGLRLAFVAFRAAGRFGFFMEPSSAVYVPDGV
jgi:hypothetical protein